MATAQSTEPKNALDRFFHISERGSTIGTEVRGGIVTFVTMAYIVILNPIILSNKPDVDGNVLDFSQVGAATALAAGIMTILFGVLATLVHSTFGEYDYREGVSVWFRNFWTLRPNAELMMAAPIFFKLHVLSALALFGIWPFTRLVHVFAAPIGYLNRPYIVYRSKDPRREAERRGWEKISY